MTLDRFGGGNKRQAEQQRSARAVIVSTATEIHGWRITRTIGIARGISVRSRGALPRLGAHLGAMVGGDVTAFERQCEENRSIAYQRMVAHAADLGATAIIAMRYDSTEMSEDITEVLAYGTAVVATQEAAG